MRLALILAAMLLLTACGSTEHKSLLSLREVVTSVRSAGYTRARVISASSFIKGASALGAKPADLRRFRADPNDVIYFDGPYGIPYLEIDRFISARSAEEARSVFNVARVCNVLIDSEARLSFTQAQERRMDRLARTAVRRIVARLRDLCPQP